MRLAEEAGERGDWGSSGCGEMPQEPFLYLDERCTVGGALQRTAGLGVFPRDFSYIILAFTAGLPGLGLSASLVSFAHTSKGVWLGSFIQQTHLLSGSFTVGWALGQHRLSSDTTQECQFSETQIDVLVIALHHVGHRQMIWGTSYGLMLFGVRCFEG